jgi:hypothetical protein
MDTMTSTKRNYYAFLEDKDVEDLFDPRDGYEDSDSDSDEDTESPPSSRTKFINKEGAVLTPYVINLLTNPIVMIPGQRPETIMESPSGSELSSDQDGLSFNYSSTTGWSGALYCIDS